MDNQTKEYKVRFETIEKIWTPDAKLWVPHENNEIAFACPVSGSNTYVNVGKEILKRCLLGLSSLKKEN